MRVPRAKIARWRAELANWHMIQSNIIFPGEYGPRFPSLPLSAGEIEAALEYRIEEYFRKLRNQLPHSASSSAATRREAAILKERL
jgi:hypothetical protein